MAKIVLDPEEIQEITDRRHHKSQAKVLTQMGICCKPRPDGSLVVLRAHVESSLGGEGTSGKVSHQQNNEPNWGAIR